MSTGKNNPLIAVIIIISVVAILFLAAALSYYIVNTGSTNKQDVNSRQNTTSKQQVNRQVKDTITEPQKLEIEYEVFDSYTVTGNKWSYVILTSDINLIDEEKLIELGKSLHEKEPETSWSIVKDSSNYDSFKNWDVNYEKSIDTDGQVKDTSDCLDMSYCVVHPAFPCDEKCEQFYSAENRLITVQKMMTAGALKWFIYDGNYNELYKF